MHNTQHLFLKLNQIHIWYILIIPVVNRHMICFGEDETRATQVVGDEWSDTENMEGSKADHSSNREGGKHTWVLEEFMQTNRQFQLI